MIMLNPLLNESYHNHFVLGLRESFFDN